jgi:hypothetical protein
MLGGARNRSGRFGEAKSFFAYRESNLDFSMLRICGVRKFDEAKKRGC